MPSLKIGLFFYIVFYKVNQDYVMKKDAVKAKKIPPVFCAERKPKG